jgi:hypothetical protein
MLFEETDTEENGNSESDVSSLDNVFFSRMRFESSSSEEQVTDTEFLEDYGMMKEILANSEDSTIENCSMEIN